MLPRNNGQAEYKARGRNDCPIDTNRCSIRQKTALVLFRKELMIQTRPCTVNRAMQTYDNVNSKEVK